jgi:hypothetical protein
LIHRMSRRDDVRIEGILDVSVLPVPPSRNPKPNRVRSTAAVDGNG